ncbi:hypothetical protein [Clostridium sp.]|uniref:hypothetical protein n=1 Tax=Clostridium sp. TaxID=1506 RepID=UPI0025C3D3B9|nr:hypothetical protein [Clostridium sp.]MBS4956718.1 hypothetical protein [Clostridium sp.]MDU4883372.1 hypothetical protein [Clostridium celatum]MDU7076435.1 hypothetical protein [Clostridium celatum]
MGVWGLDIYDDDLAVDIRDEFQDYLDQGMDENDAMNEVIFNNDNLLEEDEECGTFILTIGLLAKENEISNSKINKLLSDLRENKNYWNYLKEDSTELYEVRMDLLRELI